MESGKPFLIIAIVVCITGTGLCDVCLNIKDISGGESHTLVLMENKSAWACGSNNLLQLGIGPRPDQWVLQQVLAGDMETRSGYLEDVNDIDAGWYHSMALDNNGYAWAWGNDRGYTHEYCRNTANTVKLMLDKAGETLYNCC